MKAQNGDRTQTHVILAKGTMVSHYRIIEKIGAGGMGEVYLAEDTQLKRKVALKFLPTRFLGDADFKARFVREAEATAKLNHPNIVTIYEVSEYNGRPFFSMELVEGQSLRELAGGKELGLDRIIELAIQICDGLGAAHEKKVVHRDIKPSNIVIDAYGRPKILDFGLAAVQGGEHLTKTGSTLGTVRYMSPEQVQGQEVNQRSDLFSLGVVLYELISGRTPFEQENEAATLKAITQDNPEPLARYKADIPDELQRTVSKLLERDPSLRYQTAAGVVSDLKPLASSAIHPPTVVRVKRSKLWMAVAAFAVVVGVSLTLWLGSRDEPEPTGPPKLVVLPFENLGQEEDQYFADGMTDEITSRLAGVEGLGIISRTSAMHYRNSDKTLKDIGAELGVDYVLEGTIRWSKSGGEERVRITPQLIHVGDDRHLWADNYERELTEVFEVQSDIAVSIVEALGVTLLEPGRIRLKPIPTNNMEAYDYYLRGKALTYSVSSLHTLDSAIELFQKAVALDPEFATAYASLSEAHSIAYFVFFRMDDPSKAKQAVDRALAINPNLPDAHLALGFYYSAYLLDHERALEELAYAEKYLPNYSDVHWAFGFVYSRQGRWDEALVRKRMSLELNPLDPERYRSIADVLIRQRKYDEALRNIQRAISLQPDKTVFHSYKLWAELVSGGGLTGARRVLQELPTEVDPVSLMTYQEGAVGDEILGLWRYGLIGADSVDLPRRFTERFYTTRPHVYWASMAQIHEYLGHPDTALIYYDSSLTSLEDRVREYPEDFHYRTELGLIYSMVGRHEEAIEHSLEAMDILPMSSCHW